MNKFISIYFITNFSKTFLFSRRKEKLKFLLKKSCYNIQQKEYNNEKREIIYFKGCKKIQCVMTKFLLKRSNGTFNNN